MVKNKRIFDSDRVRLHRLAEEYVSLGYQVTLGRGVLTVYARRRRDW